MIKRTESIKCVGLFNDANGKPFTFEKATLIYAENGRGKSTMASVFRSLSIGDPNLVMKRTTIDSAAQPEIHFQFDNGHKVSFETGAWTEVRPEVLVFDSDFVEQNVHSGGVVSSGHRKNLLEFALGDAAVTARKAEEDATVKSKDASKRVKSIENKLSGFHQGLQLNEFEELAKPINPEPQIAALRKRGVAAANSVTITQKPIPTTIELPTLNVDALFGILNASLVDIEKGAEEAVKKHLANFKIPGVEKWISEGQVFDNGTNCPYCGQSTHEISLIESYKTHFNKEYEKLKTQVSQLEYGITKKTEPSVVESFINDVQTVNQVLKGWNDHVKIDPILLDEVAAKASLNTLFEKLKKLAAAKVHSILDSVGTDEEKVECQNLWDKFTEYLTTANLQIDAASKELGNFKANLKAENPQQLQAEVTQIEFANTRYTPEVVENFRLLSEARLDVKKSETLKKESREALNTLMETTLSQYEVKINALLKKFGASFTIEKLNANYRGGSPRSEYVINLRGKPVTLDEKGVPFSTALSEGDKRTLAFAFFVASTLADTDLGTKSVVVDDPMCSLDSNRRNQTKLVIKQIHEGANQVIILAHDAYFLRSVRDSLTPKDGSTTPSIFQLRFAPQGYTDFAAIDLDQECESAYYKHHRTVSECANGNNTDDHATSKSIRPLLEGYLHRRFPGLIPKNLMFGQVLSYFNDVQKPHPVDAMLPLIDELNEINGYAGQFHHDTNPDVGNVTIDSGELRNYAERALNVIYNGVI